MAFCDDREDINSFLLTGKFQFFFNHVLLRLGISLLLFLRGRVRTGAFGVGKADQRC